MKRTKILGPAMRQISMPPPNSAHATQDEGDEMCNQPEDAADTFASIHALTEEVKAQRREFAELKKHLEESERLKGSEAPATQDQQTAQATRHVRPDSSPLSSAISGLASRELSQEPQEAPQPNGKQKQREQHADAEDSGGPVSPAQLKTTQLSKEGGQKEQSQAAPKRGRGRPRGSGKKRSRSTINESQPATPPAKQLRQASRAHRATRSSTSREIPTAAQTRPLERLEVVRKVPDANRAPEPDQEAETDEESRQDAEPGEAKKRQPTKDEKKELNRVSQELLRRHKKLLQSGGLQWGEYSTEFRHPPGAEDLCGFLQALDEAAADYAHTWPDEVLRRAKTREGYGGRLNEWMWHEVLKEDFARETDVICVDGMDDLEEALGREFRKPIFHRACEDAMTGEGTNSLVNGEGFGLDRFLADRKEFHPGDMVDVHDMREDDTVKRDIKILFDAFEVDSDIRTPLNFLSLKNLTQHTFCPKAITGKNLRCQIERMRAREMARDGSAHVYNSPEFFIASTPNTISPIHVDSGGGNTWVSILEGRKIWYFPRVVDESTVRLLDSFDNLHPEDYPGGWVKVELRKGDLLVMPPSFPHAVFTPEHTLTVGGQFYTAAHLRRSLRGVVQQRMMSRVSNDDLGDEQYENLAEVLGPAADKVLSPTERRLVSAEMLHVLNDVPEWDKWEENHDHDSRRGGEGSGSEDGAAADEEEAEDEGEDGDYRKGSRQLSRPGVSQLDGPMTPKAKRVSQRVHARGTGRSPAPTNDGTGKASRGKYSVPARKVAGKPPRLSGIGKSFVSMGKKPYKCSLPKSEVNFVRAVSNFRVRNPVTSG